MVRVLNVKVPAIVSSKPSAGRNQSELKGAVKRLSRNDKMFTDLTLAWALIADDGCRQLSTSLIFNTVLTRLDLHYNDITQIGATSLAQMLKRNFTLVTLDLSYNSVGDAGAEAILRGLKENTSLTSLQLTNNGVSHSVRQAIDECLEERSSRNTTTDMKQKEVKAVKIVAKNDRFQEAFLAAPVARRKAPLAKNKYSFDLCA
ncbi:hypothetical protein GUITHDRAFT_133732 [Guillardia theta CCMP2712]|uniref:Uncharacterized protein n=1 Tax=Guillardia theta (strain CCMP2712) TaxID=905079 RepID=L1JX80_GUITC|nr:hypothetical protein GUITHDRAFT_133732 [Guillardia theta CCMP2712]EKX52708.1 hypothetical protein GUITHDRAFT_133732 [Guillardia theta CCMP2712]|eukprot:XP_005839688.1 hypothetical protein GUITHDRAFT_133732 [Guillardia theta CCMP2712]